MRRTRGKQDRETDENKSPEREEHPPFGWVSSGADFYCKIGNSEILEPNLPTSGLSHICV